MTAIQGFLDFLDESPVNFLAVSTVARHLEEAGFERVDASAPLCTPSRL